MSKTKKIIGIVGGMIAGGMCVQSIAPTYAIDRDPYYQEMENAGPATTNIAQVVSQTNQQGSLLERLLDVFDINYAGPDKALSYVQIVVNYALSLLAFIAVIVIIYGFYMMFFRDQDKGFGEARKTVIGAAIALFVIAISWIFVNFAFYVFYRGI